MLGPDAKSQVTVRYENGKPVGGDPDRALDPASRRDASTHPRTCAAIVEPYIRKALPEGWITDETVWHVNPTGKFVIGGPDGDCGLTGRKIIVDTYGGAAPHGGGAFSGKDPTKVDRSAAYAARYLAKNVVAAGLAGRCTIQLSYAIGVAKPLSIYADLHGTGEVDEGRLEEALMEVMDLSPRGIRTHLGLNKPIYARTSAYGHFGRAPEADGGFSWERTDLADTLTSRPRLTAGRRVSRRGAGGRAFFGRRKGKRLRAGQDDLVRDAPAAAAGRPGAARSRGVRCFPARGALGSRSASAAASTSSAAGPGASRRPASSAASPSSTAWPSCCATIDAEGLGNIRLWDGDATALLPPPARRPRSTGSILLYPDPWPKRRQRKRRLVSDAFLAALARVVRPGRRAPLRHRHRRLRRLGARAGAALARFPLDGRARPTTGGSPGPAGRAPATRPRRCARAACRSTSPSSGVAERAPGDRPYRPGRSLRSRRWTKRSTRAAVFGREVLEGLRRAAAPAAAGARPGRAAGAGSRASASATPAPWRRSGRGRESATVNSRSAAVRLRPAQAATAQIVSSRTSLGGEARDVLLVDRPADLDRPDRLQGLPVVERARRWRGPAWSRGVSASSTIACRSRGVEAASRRRAAASAALEQAPDLVVRQVRAGAQQHLQFLVEARPVDQHRDAAGRRGARRGSPQARASPARRRGRPAHRRPAATAAAAGRSPRGDPRSVQVATATRSSSRAAANGPGPGGRPRSCRARGTG